jgi:hypothetical protein
VSTIKKYLFLALFTVFLSNSFGQMDTLQSVLKPRIGIGTGTLAYFGEVQNYQIGFLPTINRIAGSIYVNAPVSKSFNLEFTTMYGKLGANERGLTRNLNFESRIRSGSLMLNYNFHPFFSGIKPMFNPFIGVGFTSFEFLSKTDLYDANGNMYHYWSDGAIMNLAETDPLATNAIPLYRDYVYETDLREQDYDSLGKYREQSFAIPISIGGEWHLTPRIDFRVSTTLNYSFTDLIDNISPAGSGVRQGDDKKDYYMYTSMSLSYDLEFNLGGGKIKFEGQNELGAYDQSDLDQDGIIDALDFCPKSPLEAIVDENGCPIDTDFDGVADYMDEEEDTPTSNYVDEYGITITEAEFRKRAELFNDSTGILHDFDEDILRVGFRDSEGKMIYANQQDTTVKKSYVVIIGKEHKDISANELHKYLGYNEFKTISKGDTVFYVLGEYQNIEDAVAAKSSLEDKGIDVKVIGKAKHDGSEFSNINQNVINKIEKININNGKEIPTFGKPEQVFRVQVGAFKNKVDINEIFPKIKSLVYASGEDGITRYYTGNYDNYDDAESYRKTLLKNGYDKSFVVAYKDHERVTLKEAGVDLPSDYDEDEELTTFVEPRDIKPESSGNETNNPSIDMNQVKYHVILGRFESEIPVETIDVFMSIGEITPVRNDDGSTSYYSRSVLSESDAKNLISDYETYGIRNIELAYQYKNQYYSKAEFLKLAD